MLAHSRSYYIGSNCNVKILDALLLFAFLDFWQARKIEAQLDEQMHSYRRLVSTNKALTKSDGAESDLEAGIDLLLRQLQQVNAQMQAWVSSGGSEMVSHTLTRHQEILQDLTQVIITFSDSHHLTNALLFSLG